MIPVRQTRFGYPDGNCMAACVASLLELPIEEMPIIPADDDFNRLWNGWLMARGFSRFTFAFSAGAWVPDGYHLLAGPSPRPISDENNSRVFHVVVGLNGKPVHDPHPEDMFLAEIHEVEIIYPLDPSKAVAR